MSPMLAQATQVATPTASTVTPAQPQKPEISRLPKSLKLLVGVPLSRQVGILAGSAAPVRETADDDEKKDSKVLVAGVDYAVQKRARSVGRAGEKDGMLFNATGCPQLPRTPTGNNVFRVVQSYINSAFITSSSVTPSFVSAAFTVNALDQISSLTSVFDQYRITDVEVWLIPRTSVIESSTANAGLLASCIDYDDMNALATFGQALDYSNVLVGGGIEGHYRHWKPHAAVAAYSGAFTSYANVESPWIDAASTTVQHYGLKTAWTVTDTAYVVDAIVRLHTEWKNVR